jgi:hypothetical protein
MASLLTRLTKQDIPVKYIGILLKAFRNEMAVAAQSNHAKLRQLGKMINRFLAAVERKHQSPK